MQESDKECVAPSASVKLMINHSSRRRRRLTRMPKLPRRRILLLLTYLQTKSAVLTKKMQAVAHKFIKVDCNIAISNRLPSCQLPFILNMTMSKVSTSALNRAFPSVTHTHTHTHTHLNADRGGSPGHQGHQTS